MPSNIAILHYSAAPVVGGVEAVIQAHAGQFAQAGYRTTIIAGRGDTRAMPDGVEYAQIEEMDTLHPEIVEAAQALNTGSVPANFENLVNQLTNRLEAILPGFESILIHNVFTKHFNLPLTAALHRLLDLATINHVIAWCHDLSWSSEHSRPNLHPGYPWDLLKTAHPAVTYVAVSKKRQGEMVNTLGIPAEKIPVIYNGIDYPTLAGLSPETIRLAEGLDLESADLILIMPVRITQAKNIELAIKIVAEIKKNGLKPKLIVTGPPDPHDPKNMAYYQELLSFRQKSGVGDEVAFVYELGPQSGVPYLIDERMVGELYRLSDALMMTSHREGFGMPILEAGGLGLPIISTLVPAVEEIAVKDVLLIDPAFSVDRLSEKIIQWMKVKPEYHLRVETRQNYTWGAIFAHKIFPLLSAHNQ